MSGLLENIPVQMLVQCAAVFGHATAVVSTMLMTPVKVCADIFKFVHACSAREYIRTLVPECPASTSSRK